MLPKGYDYIIVGQGLAGSTLAFELCKRGRRLCLIDDPGKPSSSRIAAGLFNPVTGRKMVLTWKAEALFSYLHMFYPEAERLTGSSFFHPAAIYRPFITIDEQNDWMGRSAGEPYANFIDKVEMRSCYSWVNDRFGGLRLKNSGVLDVYGYLEAMCRYLSERADVLNETFSFREMSVTEDGIIYRGMKSTRIIFCEGSGAVNNEWFNWLPFRPVKGEIFEIQLKKHTEEIINRGIFVIPLGGEKFRVGSTYDNHDQTWEPTEKGKKQLEENLAKLITSEYSIQKHYAGIRPSSADRRPILGLHPEKETIGIFNGLGTKGVSLAPYYANQLANYLDGTGKLDDEVNINRYFSLY